MTDITYDQQLHLTLLDHTVKIVNGWAPLNADNIGGAAKAIYAALRDAAGPIVEPTPEIDKPTARQIADAVQADSILCFEDGKRYKSLKRTVRKFGLTPDEVGPARRLSFRGPVIQRDALGAGQDPWSGEEALMTYYLIITMFSLLGNTQLESIAVPTTYYSIEACNQSGEAARTNYNGGAKIEWTCVPGMPDA